MSDREHRTPLRVEIRQDVSDGFRVPGYDPKLALERKGAIIFELKRNGREGFEVYLIDKQYRRGRPSVINLNINGLFEVVQACRTRWEQALESLTTTRPASSGAGKKPYRPYENTWDNPVDQATFHGLAGKLAVAGDRLFSAIFERHRHTPLDDIAAKLRQAARSGSFVMTVSAPDFHIPWRMLYTHPDATEALAEDGSNFEPSGFWGSQHVIEQFTREYDIRDHVLAREGKLSFGAALHERIDRDFIQASTNRLLYAEWTKKADVTTRLRAKPFEQQVLYFLCHAEGAGSTDSPSLRPPALELSDGTIGAVEIRDSVCNRFEPSPPLVFINACRGGQLNTLVRHNFTFATEFLEQGAVCVIGPQIEVPAVFAGEFGKRFFERFIAQTDPPPQVGIILRDLTREMWDLHRNPFGLVYSLYAGADCHICWDEEHVA
jgi:hypothetical protein